MLVDPINFTSDPVTDILARMRGSDGGQVRVRQGVYIIGHFNMDHSLPGGSSFDGQGAAWCQYPDLQSDEKYFGCYGVCDSPEQLLTHPFGQWLAASVRRFTVSFTCVRKVDQSPDGGWRWHKWGEYIGTKDPQHEYLYDEGPEIEEVYCFHVYECLDPSKAVAC
jgi:hypothetical protein